MNDDLKKFYLFLKWFFIIILVETAILINLVYTDLLLIKLLINYLFLAGIIPLIYERIYKGRVDIFSPLAVFTFFYLLLFGVRAVDLIAFNKDAVMNEERFYTLAILFAIVGLHSFHVGYFSKIGASLFKKGMKAEKVWEVSRLKIILIWFSVISVLSFLLIVKLSGGFYSYFGNIRNAMVNVTTGKTIVFMMVLLVQIPLIIWFCYLLKNNSNKTLFIIYLLFASLLLISLGERGHFITLIISLVICWHYIKKRIRFVQVFTLSFLLITFLIIYGKYRDFTEQDLKIKRQGFVLKLSLKQGYRYFVGHFDQVRYFKDVVKSVPDELNFQYGKTLANLLLKPIPSLVWKEKPQGAGRVITKSIYPKANSLGVTVAPSILAELYLNFHIIGIILGMLIFGIISKALYKILLDNPGNNNIIVVYAICMPYFFGELRGDFSVVTSFLIFKLLFLFIALKFISPEGLFNKKHCL